MSEKKAKFFRALGDETRLTILGYLLKNEHCACSFTDIDTKDQTTISRHLKVLTEAGLIKHRKSGRNIIYSINNDDIRNRLLSMDIEQHDACCEANVPKNDHVKQIVKVRYGKIAREGGSCGCGSDCCGEAAQAPIQISSSLGYSDAELEIAPESNLGLGCGNPGALGKIQEGDVVLDLGSGAGMDAFIAAKKVGASGRVIGVDFTEDMIKKARRNAKKNGFTNVEFRHGDIEDLPVKSDSIDVILSNCVINLAPNKSRVFEEAYRVLRPGGRIFLSDMVLLEELTKEQRSDEDLISGCVGGAILKGEYLKLMKKAGFQLTQVSEDTDISRRQYRGLPVESVKIVAEKK